MDRDLVGYSPCGHKELDKIELLTLISFFFSTAILLMDSHSHCSKSFPLCIHIYTAIRVIILNK